MTCWTAILPLKSGADRKSRLANVLPPAARRDLGEAMAGTVIEALHAVAAIREIRLLTDAAQSPWPVRLVPDAGRGLNGELDAAARAIAGGVLIILGDLPLISDEDIAALLRAADQAGAAIAPDRHGTGTNALALRHWPEGFGCAFGVDSFRQHCARLPHRPALVERFGLACDIDTRDDLDAALALGFRPACLA